MVENQEIVTKIRRKPFGKTLGLLFKAFQIPIIATLVTSLVSMAWNYLERPTGYSYSHHSQPIVKKEIGSTVWYVMKKGTLLSEKPLYLHQFDIFPPAQKLPAEEEEIKFSFESGALYDYEISYTQRNTRVEIPLAKPKETESSVETEFPPGQMEKLTAKILLNVDDRPTLSFKGGTVEEQSRSPFPWDFAILTVLITILAIVFWNHHARPRLKISDYEQSALIILVVIFATPVIGGLFRFLLAMPLKTYLFNPTDPIPDIWRNQPVQLFSPLWIGAMGTFLMGLLVVLVAEVVLPHEENPTLAQMQGWTMAGLFWGLLGSFLISIAYEPESFKAIGWFTNRLRYSFVITGLLWGLGIALGGHVGNRVGTRLGQPIIGRAGGAILGSLIVLLSTLLPFTPIFTYRDSKELENLISRSWGDALTQWFSIVFVVVTYYLVKAIITHTKGSDKSMSHRTRKPDC